MRLKDVIDVLLDVSEEERGRAAREALQATAHFIWKPNPGPQTDAYFSDADEILFGGQAGGGKSDILLGLAINEHRKSLILRRINEDAQDLGSRLVEIVGTRGFSSRPPTYRGDGKIIELRGCEGEKDKQRYKGRPHDFIGYDELADFLESQYLFINGWLRSADPNQRCRIVAASNPPTTAEGQWIVRRWAPWLDKFHPKPAEEGELRWFIRVEDQDVEVDGPGPHVIEGRRRPIKAMSRTFIRSTLDDNWELSQSDYGDRLESMPEELRRAYSEGDFSVGLKDDDFQVLPSAWLEAAFQRWSSKPPRLPMSAMGVDVAQGGPAETVAAFRHGGWFGELASEPGDRTREGRAVAAMVVRHRRNNCPVIVDVGGGWGGDALIALKDNGIEVVAFNGVVTVTSRTRDGKLKFVNKRAEATWRFREELDPEQEGGSSIALPPDPKLKADLASYRWKLTPNGILVEPKADIIKRLGRSTDRGDAVVMCSSEGDRAIARMIRRGRERDRPSRANVGHSKFKERVRG